MKLKDLMDKDLASMDDSQKDQFFDLLKDAELLLPVEILVEDDDLDNIIPTMVNTHNGKVITPLFTDHDEINDESILTISFSTFDIVTILDQFKVDGVVINPFSKNLVAISVDTLVQLFFPFDDLVEEIRTLLRSNSTTLAGDTELYLRTSEPFNNPFCPKIPINASSNENLRNDLPYLNILKFSKGDKIMYVGDVVDENDQPDVVLAPNTEFELIDKKDDATYVWKCVGQSFYDE